MSNPTFEGFEAANTTPVPDVLFDELLPKLSGPQLKVLLYIIRRTAGFKKSSDGISLSQFTDGIKTRDGKVLDNGCGIKKRSSVSKVLRELIAMGCVESAKAKTDMGDDAVTTYSVRFKGVGAKLALPSDETSTTVVPKQPLPGSAQIGTRGSAQIGTHKKQLTRNSNKQETDLQGVTYDSAIATSSPALSNLPSVQYLEEIKATREVVGEKIIELDERRAALSEQDSYSPVTLAGGYEKKEDEDGSTDVSACRAGSTGGLPDSAPVSNQRSAQRTGRTEKAAEQPTLIVEKKPMTLDAQVDASFQVLDHVRQLATGDPMASYVRSKASRNLLKDLIKDCAGTPKEINTANLTLAWNAMWNAPRWSNGMSWQDAGKLTIKAFCNNYGEYLDIGRQAAQKQNKPANTGRTVSGMRRLGSAASAATTL